MQYFHCQSCVDVCSIFFVNPVLKYAVFSVLILCWSMQYFFSYGHDESVDFVLFFTYRHKESADLVLLIYKPRS